MGSGKIIQGMGVSNFYHPDPQVFMQTIADTFGVNAETTIVETYQTLTLNRQYPQTVHIAADNYGKSNMQYDYSVSFPIVHEHTNKLSFIFYPNQLFCIVHLPFTNGWRFFLDEITGDYDSRYLGRKNLLQKYAAVKNLYTYYLKKLACPRLLLYTDFNTEYKWEDMLIYTDEPPSCTFDELISSTKELDNMVILDLQEAFAGKHNKTINKLYHEDREEYRIGFIDEVEALERSV